MTKTNANLLMIAICVPFLLAGCLGGPDDSKKAIHPAKDSKLTKGPEAEDEIEQALSKLEPEDRKLAEAQEFCAVNTKSKLGSMDTPEKILLNGQPVFLCCGGCEKKAKADPDKTLATVAELKKKHAAAAK